MSALRRSRRATLCFAVIHDVPSGDTKRRPVSPGSTAAGSQPGGTRLGRPCAAPVAPTSATMSKRTTRFMKGQRETRRPDPTGSAPAAGSIRGDAALVDEHLHDLGETLERGEGEKDHAAGRVGARKALDIDVDRRLLVEPDEVERGALPLGTALVVALEDEHRDAVLLPARLGLGAGIAMVLHAAVVEQVRHADRRARPADQVVAGDHAGAPLALVLGRTDQRLLRRLAHREKTVRADPAAHRTIEALALPVARIFAGEMIGHLRRAAGGLAALVAGPQASLAMLRTAVVEFTLLRIRPVSVEPGAREATLLLDENGRLCAQRRDLEIFGRAGGAGDEGDHVMHSEVLMWWTQNEKRAARRAARFRFGCSDVHAPPAG